MDKLLCKRCGHDWTPRVKLRKPRLCPNCKSKYWDSELAVKPGPERKYEVK